MNTTQLHSDCKKFGREVFENFKHHLKYYPFNAPIDIEGTIDFDIHMEFGRKVLKHHITGRESAIQLKMMLNIIASYKKIIVSTCWEFGKRFVENN